MKRHNKEKIRISKFRPFNTEYEIWEMVKGPHRWLQLEQPTEQDVRWFYLETVKNQPTRVEV